MTRTKKAQLPKILQSLAEDWTSKEDSGHWLGHNKPSGQFSYIYICSPNYKWVSNQPMYNKWFAEWENPDRVSAGGTSPYYFLNAYADTPEDLLAQIIAVQLTGDPMYKA